MTLLCKSGVILPHRDGSVHRCKPGESAETLWEAVLAAGMDFWEAFAGCCNATAAFIEFREPAAGGTVGPPIERDGAKLSRTRCKTLAV